MEVANVCRVCMISSDVFEYCSLMEKTIFKNIRLSLAFKLITGLDISDDDDLPKLVCFRCEKQLQNAYHFRQLAESSSKHFAAICSKNSNNNQTPPRILNSRKNDDRLPTTRHLDDGEQLIEITNQSSQNIDATLKSEIDSDEEASCTSPAVVYVVDADGDIEVKPRQIKEIKSSSTLSQSISVDIDETTYECNSVDNDQDEHSDAISFLLNNKHLKTKDDSKDEAYHSRRFECTVCTKKFVGKSNLIDHLRYHANIRNYQCTFCDKSFVQSGSLKSHLRTHTAEKPYNCSHCNKGFGQKSALTVHIRTHTQERKYVCETCCKAFMTTGDLMKHKLIHESVKKFSCDLCGMRSAQKVNIKKHKLRVHGVSIAEQK